MQGRRLGDGHAVEGSQDRGAVPEAVKPWTSRESFSGALIGDAVDAIEIPTPAKVPDEAADWSDEAADWSTFADGEDDGE